MPVVELDDGLPATIAGFTESFCIYRIVASGALGVASWRNIALGNVCPAKPLLPATAVDNDVANASAAVLREILALKQFGLTAIQVAARDELVARLCNDVTTVS